MKRSSEHGGAMLVTLILISSVLTGASVMVSMQLSSNRQTELVRTGLSSNYCAEAGLVAARSVVATQYTNWASALQACASGPFPCAEPQWLKTAVGSHDLDGDGVDDFALYIKDDDDELTGANDTSVDTNLRVYLISRCIKYPDYQREMQELVQFSGAGQGYESQQGGNGGNGNTN
jgi:hypothetical protein